MNYVFLCDNVHSEKQKIGKFHLKNKFLICKLFSLVYSLFHKVISISKDSPNVSIKSDIKGLHFLSRNDLPTYHGIFTKGLSSFFLESDQRCCSDFSEVFLLALVSCHNQWCRTALLAPGMSFTFFLCLCVTGQLQALALIKSRLIIWGWNFISSGIKYLGVALFVVLSLSISGSGKDLTGQWWSLHFLCA